MDEDVKSGGESSGSSGIEVVMDIDMGDGELTIGGVGAIRIR